MSRSVMTVILGGGRGSRLAPLTLYRAKPAVPLGGKYRLIDIPVSNSINSGYRYIFVLTQFNSASLNSHVSRTYHFDEFTKGFVRILAAEQTDAASDWYQGTADAVRKQIHHFARADTEHVLILSGDHLYRMDYRELVERHVQTKADVTIASMPIDEQDASRFGLVVPDDQGITRGFVEKPTTASALAEGRVPTALKDQWGLASGQVLGNMGIYVFRRQALIEALEQCLGTDFGRDVLPWMLDRYRVAAFGFAGYWEDIGTIDTFFEANLKLCLADPPFRFFDKDAPIYTRPRFLPATKFFRCEVVQSIVSEGSILSGDRLEECVVGIRTRFGKRARARRAIILGSDYYDAEDGQPRVGIGADSVLERVIVDKNARIGEGCRLIGRPDLPDRDGTGWCVREGIVIVEKNAVLEPGTVVE